MKRTTIDDVAKTSGVSKETVLAVINAGDSVRPQTREMVLDVMRSLDYHPRGLASNLKRDAHDRSIGIIMKDFSYPFYQSIVIGVKEYAETRDYSVIVTSSEDNQRSEERLKEIRKLNISSSSRDLTSRLFCWKTSMESRRTLWLSTT
jgi:LacI family transcriptional regulator